MNPSTTSSPAPAHQEKSEDASSAPTEPRRGWSIYFAAVLPVAVMAIVLAMHQVPAEVREASVDLGGEWQSFEGDGPAGPDSVPVGGTWHAFQIPSQAFLPFPGQVSWIKRTVELPEAIRAQPAYLKLGGFRSGAFTVFVNGLEIAQGTSYGGEDGWTLLPAIMQPTTEIAVRSTWGLPGDNGFEDPRWMVGPVDVLQPHFSRERSFKGFIQFGVLFMVPFALALILVLRSQTTSTVRRAMYVSALRMLFTGGLYVYVMGNATIPDFVGHAYVLPILFLCVLGMLDGMMAFIELYFLERRTRFGRFQRWLLASMAALTVVLTPLGQFDLILGLMALFNLNVFIAVSYQAVMMFFAKRKNQLLLAPVLVSANLVFLLSGVNDVLIELFIAHTPRLLALAMSNVLIAVTCVVIADFIQLFEVNKALSRSLQLTNVDLSKALVAATESARVKGEFVANMSHELRTPLNSIINVPAGLLDNFNRRAVIKCSACKSTFEPEGDERIEPGTACPECAAVGTLSDQSHWGFYGEAAKSVQRLQSMWRSGMHLLNLIDGVLDFSKIDAGKMTIQVRPVSVRDLVLGVAATITPIAETRKLTIRVVPPPEGVEVKGDPTRLAQVLMNLTGNALKFTPEGKSIEIGAEVRGDRCRIWVRDEGIGISSADQALVFESFRQIDSSHTRPYGGTGLGLAIAKNLVEMHEGTLTLESAEGQGSIFIVELPLDGPVKADNLSIVALPQHQPRIMIVADDPLVVSGMSMSLQSLRFTVSGTTDLAGVPALMQTLRPNLLILDRALPGKSLVRLLDEWTGDQALPVVVIGAPASEAQALRQRGAVLLSTPWLIEDLSERVREMLERVEQKAA